MQKTLFKRLAIALVPLTFSLTFFTGTLSASAVTAATFTSSFTYLFMVDGTMYETGSAGDSSSAYWWLNSGAKLVLKDGLGLTAHGSLPDTNPWRTLYASSNPTDTDNGYHPQNLFRLVTRSAWNNAHVESKFRIDADNFSSSPNRNSSNGLLLMLRYHSDGQTLYYAGIRVDGTAVLKKKINGVYYTMAQQKVFPGTYSVAANVNLLPHHQWLTLGGNTVTHADGSVTVDLYLTKPGEVTPTKILSVTDSGQFGGTAPITGSYFSGIRTDFMDVALDDFKVNAL